MMLSSHVLTSSCVYINNVVLQQVMCLSVLCRLFSAGAAPPRLLSMYHLDVIDKTALRHLKSPTYM